MINCDDHGLLDFKSAVQCMKHFIYHFTILIILIKRKLGVLQRRQTKDQRVAFDLHCVHSLLGRLLGAIMIQAPVPF